MEIVVSIVAVG